MTPKQSKFGPEHWRYKNDKESYNALVRLLGPARYHKNIPMRCVDDQGLSADFNPAKVTSSRFNSFVDRTGGDETWECEALPPAYLVDQVRAAIKSNMNMKVFDAVVEQEKCDCERLREVRAGTASELEI